MYTYTYMYMHVLWGESLPIAYLGTVDARLNLHHAIQLYSSIMCSLGVLTCHLFYWSHDLAVNTVNVHTTHMIV